VPSRLEPVPGAAQPKPYVRKTLDTTNTAGDFVRHSQEVISTDTRIAAEALQASQFTNALSVTLAALPKGQF
jgi:hypothetical protein